METLRDRFKFHQENGGGVVGSQAIGSWAKAKAQAWKDQEEEAGRLRVLWDYAEDFDLKGFTDQEDLEALTRRRLEDGSWTVENCMIQVSCGKCGQWETAAALSWIVGPSDDPYRRTVEAELALEAMASRTRPTLGQGTGI